MGQNIGVGCHFLLQWLFLTQGSKPLSCIAGGFFTIEPPGRPKPLMPMRLKLTSSMKTYKIEWTPKENVLFMIGDWNGKVGSQEIPGVSGKFGLRIQNETGQRLTEFWQENRLVIANTLFHQHKGWLYIWTIPNGQYWNKLIIFFAAQDGEALCSQ